MSEAESIGELQPDGVATQLWHNDGPARGVRFARRRRLNGWRPVLRPPKTARSPTLFTS